MDARKLQRLRDRALGLLRELEAIAVFGNMMTARRRAELEGDRENVAKHSTIRTVADLIELKRRQVAALREFLGVKASTNRLLGLLKMVERAPEGKCLLVPKYLVRELFANPERTFLLFDALPEHARLYIWATKPPRHAPDEMNDWGCAEALLYEDMCALFNLAREHRAKIRGGNVTVKRQKLINSLTRAATATSFHFLESYLSGLAFDFCLANEARLASEEKAALTEWDAARGRQKFLSLREKLLQYPRIIIGAAHPPLQESSCPEMAFLVEEGKRLRDAIVHANPRPDPRAFEPDKETILFNPDFVELERVVDSTVALVRKIEAVVHSERERLFWLFDRGKDGAFPDIAFE